MDANGVGRGLKHREINDAYIDMVYPAFDGFDSETQGVSKGEILLILSMLNRKAAEEDEDCNAPAE